MNFTTLTLLCLGTYVVAVEWASPITDLDTMDIYSLGNCVRSTILRRHNSTHALAQIYSDFNCTTKSGEGYVAVDYINNVQYYIDESYYEHHIYSTKKCNDEDFSIPITGYHLMMKEHCNTEMGINQPVQIGFYDHSEDRVYAIYDDFGVNSSICSRITAANAVGASYYVGECYHDGYSSFKVFYNKRRFETDDVDPLALIVVFIVVILVI